MVTFDGSNSVFNFFICKRRNSKGNFLFKIKILKIKFKQLKI